MHEAIGKQASMTEHEEYVRSRWERVLVCDGSYRHYAKGKILFNWANHCFHEFADWAAAYAFTVERERQIRDVEEEIELHKDWREILSGPKRLIVWERTADRLQTALAELRKGMRQ